MLAARKTRNLRGSFRPHLPWTEKRSERFRNYRPERSTFQCSRTATANRSTHIIPHGSGKRRGRGNLRNQEDLAARNEYKLKDFRTLYKTRRDLPEIGRFSSRRDGLRSLCWSLSFCAETKPQVNRMRHKTHALFLLVRLFNLMKTADYLAVTPFVFRPRIADKGLPWGMGAAREGSAEAPPAGWQRDSAG